MRNHRTAKKGAGGKLWMALLIVLIILLSIVLAGLLYVSHLLGLINFPGDSGGFISKEELLAYLEGHREEYDPNYDGEILDSEDIRLETMEGELIYDENVINILLVGQDARPGETRARADAMILCSYHKVTKELTLTSFMRDLYVEIPDYPAHKLNAAYAWGGMNLLERTLAWNFGIVVDGTFCVDFSSFASVIDEIGGVDIALTAAEARYLNGNLYREGVNHLDGQTALTYARIRSIGNGDFERTSRQQKVINAIVEQSRGMSLRELNRMLETVLPLLSTNMKKSEILDYAAVLLPNVANLKMNEKQRVPAEGAYRNAWVSDMAVLLPDLEKNREILKDTIYNS